MINEAMINEWKRQAKEAGKDSRGNLYYDEYEYHLGMFANPLPFQQWKMKYESLMRLQSSPNYDNDLSDASLKREQKLCNELGY